jgi:hypothetical protein
MYIVGVGSGTQNLFGLVEVATRCQQVGQLPGAPPVAGLGGVPVQRYGVAVQQPVAGAVRQPDGIGRVTEVAEEGVPGAGWYAGVSAFPACLLDQVIRHGVSGHLAYASCGGAEGGRGAVQFAGGVDEGVLEPVARRLGLLRAGAIIHRGGTGPVLLGRAELRADTDDCGQLQHLPFPGMRIRNPGNGHGDVGSVPVWPQRPHDQHRVRDAQQRLHCTANLPDRGSADQQHEPAPLRRGFHLGPDAELCGVGVARHVLGGSLSDISRAL